MEQASTPDYIRTAQADIRKALADADSFISGFDGDDMQEPGSIEALRASIARALHLLTPATLDAPKVKRYCCAACGGTNIFYDAWVPVNEDDDENEVRTFDDTHCEDCEGACSIEEVEDETEAPT